MVGVATYIVVRGRAAPKVEGCPPGRHVGAPSYSWPRPDLFLDESGFGEALEGLGYDVGDWSAEGWRVCSKAPQQAVEEFQHDYNLVRGTVEAVTGQPSSELATTGLIDDGTTLALAAAHDVQTAGYSWPVLVVESKGQT